jgi:hypothetical protein
LISNHHHQHHLTLTTYLVCGGLRVGKDDGEAIREASHTSKQITVIVYKLVGCSWLNSATTAAAANCWCADTNNTTHLAHNLVFRP